MRRFPYAIPLVVCFLVAPALFAQFETSEVLGSVHDLSNSRVPNAAVTLTNQQTGVEAKTATNENGEYDFFNVQIGLYTVKVEHPGFSVASAADIRVDVNARQRVDIVLEVGAVSDTVNVTAAASMLTTDSSEHSQVIGTQAMCRTAAEWPRLRQPCAAFHQCRAIAHLGFVRSHWYAARGRF